MPTKLYLFAIGGSGARVVKALTFLLAAGADIQASEVIPIIVDPDRSNADVNRTIDILTKYKTIRQKAVASSGASFFKTRIATLRDLSARADESATIAEGFRFALSGVTQERFRDFIDYGQLDEPNKALIELLFSEENLNTDMEVGFKGNPNVGSVVLNQIKSSPEFVQFASSFEADDRIFIISSIFGGTGAAGFPLILKNIRNATAELPNHAFLRDAKIGAITMLPYFGVEPASASVSRIDKATFLSKAKAALSYYRRNITGNRSVNALYYIGDVGGRDYKNAEGSIDQRNDAHFVELASALAVMDFARIEDAKLQVRDGRAVEPVYKEYGLERDAQDINFSHLGARSRREVRAQLTQYFFFMRYLDEEFANAIGRQPWTNASGVKYTQHFLTDNFYRNELQAFNTHMKQWLAEMERNRRSFRPFILNGAGGAPFDLVIDSPPRRSRLPWAKDQYVLYNDVLNGLGTRITASSPEQKLIALFSEATHELVTGRKFNFSERI